MRSASSNESKTHGATIVGLALLILGIVIAFYGMAADVSVETRYLPGEFGVPIPDRVVNLDALSQREMLFHAGIVSMLIGAIFMAAGMVLSQLQRIAIGLGQREQED